MHYFLDRVEIVGKGKDKLGWPLWTAVNSKTTKTAKQIKHKSLEWHTQHVPTLNMT